MLEYLVLYESMTGNTKNVAYRLFQELPGGEKNILEISEISELPQAKTYCICFPVLKGTCSSDVISAIESIGGARVAFFATCGSAPDHAYLSQIEQRVSVFLESDNEYLGMFLCQGRMPIDIRYKYEAMRTPANSEHIDRMLANFEEAMIHPNEEDYTRLRTFAANVVLK